MACEKGHDSIVQLLLNNGADVNLCEQRGGSPLYIACYFGHTNTMKLLLNNGANEDLCTMKGDNPLRINQERL